LKLHGSEAERFVDCGFVTRKLIGYLKRHVAGFGVHTREELGNFKKLGFDERRFSFVKNAVEIERPAATGDSRRTGRFKLLFVARFISAKGLLESIRACALLRQNGCDVELVAVGDGEVRPDAERLVGELGLADAVRFTGYIPETEVTRHFFQSDIFVFPTRHPEGFPNVLFKAVAAGLPIVTTRIRAAADYLNEPANCLYTSQDPEQIAARIAELIENKQMREAMSESNLELGKSLLPSEIAREFLAIYAKL
jgi:glycosyltransferase involved in cell wall biosynthesis